MNVSRRYLLLGLGVLATAAALAIPSLARPMFWGPGFGTTPAVSEPVTIDNAGALVTEALAASGYVDLVPEEVMEFSNHFYVVVKEESTGIGAFELIVERSGFVHPEPGPNMMWNTKYGHMGGMMGAGGGTMGGPGMMGRGRWGWHGERRGAPLGQPISRERARRIASRYLNSTFPGSTPDEGTQFYGYFTFDVERDGQTTGMLSVNAYTGGIWYHTWHGTFVAEKHL